MKKFRWILKKLRWIFWGELFCALIMFVVIQTVVIHEMVNPEEGLYGGSWAAATWHYCKDWGLVWEGVVQCGVMVGVLIEIID